MNVFITDFSETHTYASFINKAFTVWWNNAKDVDTDVHLSAFVRFTWLITFILVIADKVH